MAVIHLGFHLCAGFGTRHSHTLGVDHHHIITHLHARRKGWFVLAKQDPRDARGDPSKDFAIGIHKHPLAFDFACFRIVRLVHFLISVSFLIDQLTQCFAYQAYVTSTNVSPCAGAKPARKGSFSVLDPVAACFAKE